MLDFVGREDAPVIAALKQEGVIPICRSNLPQYMFVGHSTNELYGRAMNPYDESRTSGGSSGGDSALVASKCVPLGLGTDIGGSVRSPAATCGIVTFKCTP